VAVFWPASGIAAGILIVLGARGVPALVIGVVVGTVAANLMSDRSLLTSILKGFCNAGEAVLAAWLLARWFGPSFTFCNLGRVAGFLGAAGFAAVVSAIGGAATLTLFHTYTTAPYWDVWREWFLSGWVGLVVVAPLVIELAQVWRTPPARREWIEGLGVLGLTWSACLFTMSAKTGSWLSFSPSAFVLPLLLWLTARCQPIFGMAGAFLASAGIISATTFGVGRFGDAAVPLAHRVAGAQSAMMVVTLFTLVLAVLFAQRKKAEGSLAKERAMLARLHEVGSRLWRTRDLSQALDEILGGAIELMGADKGAIRILDTTRGVLTVEAHRGFKPEFLAFIDEVPAAADSPCGRALRSGERMMIEDVEADTLFAAFRPIARAAGYRAVQSTPIMNRDGMPLGMLATYFHAAHKPDKPDLRLLDLYVRQAADIIERHRAEDALRASEERLRLAQLKTGIGVWDRDLRTGKLALTPELEALLGLEPGTVKSYADFRARVHPDDIGTYEAERDAAVRRRETYKTEYRIVRPDGQVRWMLATGGAFYNEATGEPMRLVGNDADVTARKQIEQVLAERNAQLELANKIGRIGSFTIDYDTGVIRLSPGCATLYGLPEGTVELAPKDSWTFVHPEDLAGLDARLRQALLEQQREFVAQFRIIRADNGEVRWVEIRSIILYGEDGRPLRMVGASIDFTELRTSELHKSALIAELDHRVKNVLATVSTVASRTHETSSSMVEFVAALDGRIKSMASTHELLSSRHWQGVPLAELVRRELAPYATTSNTRIEGPNVVLSAEAGQTLAMVLHELATNAAKFGAFSVTSGCVSVRWNGARNRQEESWFYIDWEESGGPRVISPTRAGFGTTVVRELVPYELGGSVDLAYLPEGACCKLRIPMHWLSL
jgi:PAS domain S-box-containing protein